MRRVVIDTNVYVSRIISPRGTPAKIFKALEKKRFVLITSTEILDELSVALSYSKIKNVYKLKDADINKYLEGLTEISEQLAGKTIKKLSIVKEDPKDDKFLEAAEAGNAGFIVTGDKHLLKLENYKKTKIITPTEFLKELKTNSI